ncbi:MAG: hypothetical protein R3F61_25410 [Myxococcota bacterium]
MRWSEGFVVLWLAGCTGSPADTDTDTDAGLPDDLGTCADGTALTWADVEPVFTPNCARCHASTLTGPDRNGATVGVDFDAPETARNGAFLTWSQIYTEKMPKTGDLLSTDDALLIWEWLSCGGPE